MQIDFHHAATYVAARLAGFPDSEAKVVAWSSQFVDDAVEAGYIAFANGGMYCHVASAHKKLDYRDFNALANHRVWVPFHFLPGNEGLPAGEGNTLPFTRRVICRPDSYVAQEMVNDCLRRKDSPYALHHLGITLHVYADTWAHQGFSGICDPVNQVHDLRDARNEPYYEKIRHINDYYSRAARLRNRLNDYAARHPRFRGWLKEWLGIDLGSATTELMNLVLPLGHGAALSLPDKPYLVWRYKNGAGQDVVRNNPKDFLAAADALCRAMQRYLGNRDTGLPASDKKTMYELFCTLTDDDRAARHLAWLEQIRDGAFSFGKVEAIDYIESGPGSWKDMALVLGEGEWNETFFPYLPSFLSSHWKLFHDALQVHRLYVLHELLPRYGICAA